MFKGKAGYWYVLRTTYFLASRKDEHSGDDNGDDGDDGYQLLVGRKEVRISQELYMAFSTTQLLQCNTTSRGTCVKSDRE
jgi:hypothetical protein